MAGRELILAPVKDDLLPIMLGALMQEPINWQLQTAVVCGTGPLGCKENLKLSCIWDKMGTWEEPY